MVNFERTYDLSKKLTTSKDSSTGHQDWLGVILATQGEILRVNNTKNATLEDSLRGLEKQLMALVMYRRLAKTAAGTGTERLLRRLL